MKKLLTLISFVAALTPANIAAQIITGVVIENESKMPIGGAIVELIGVDRARDGVAVTDTAGAFVLRPRRAGSFIINVTHPSYISRDSMGLNVRAGLQVQVELRMGRRAIPLEPLVVKTTSTARVASFYERARRGTGFGKFITREAIENRGETRYATDLLREIEGVEILGSMGIGRGEGAPMLPPGTPGETNPRVRMIKMSSGTFSCLPSVFVDGVLVKQYGDNGIDDFLTPDMIEGIEVYPRNSAAPLELTTQNQCGVVAFWTRMPTEESGRLTWKRIRVAGAIAAVMLGLIAIVN